MVWQKCYYLYCNGECNHQKEYFDYNIAQDNPMFEFYEKYMESFTGKEISKKIRDCVECGSLIKELKIITEYLKYRFVEEDFNSEIKKSTISYLCSNEKCIYYDKPRIYSGSELSEFLKIR